MTRHPANVPAGPALKLTIPVTGKGAADIVAHYSGERYHVGTAKAISAGFWEADLWRSHPSMGPQGLEGRGPMGARKVRIAGPARQEHRGRGAVVGVTAEPLTLFGTREISLLPLTCEFCRRAPAGWALVNDLATGRVTHLLCGLCADRNIGCARRISKTGASAWLFELMPAAEVAAREDDDHA